MRRRFRRNRRKVTRRKTTKGRRLGKRNQFLTHQPYGSAYGSAGGIAGAIGTAYSAFKGGSTTKTTTSKRSNALPNQIGTGVFKKTVTWGRYRKSDPAIIKTITPKYTYVDQYGSRLESAQGVQGFTHSNLNIFTPKDLQTMSGITTDATSPINVYIKGGSIKVMGVNASNHNIRVTFYNIVSKRSIGPEHQPALDWQDGYVDQGLTTAASNTVGATPYDVSRFGTNWTIWKTTVYRLSQGESLEHDCNININKMISGPQLWDIVNETASATSNVGAYKGITHYMIMVLHGYPAHDTTTETSVSLPRVALDFTIQKKFSYYKQQVLPKATTQVNLYSSILTLETVNVDTGVENAVFS